MKAHNILFISHDGMTDPLGSSQVIPYLQGLTKYGYSFTILSAEKKDRFEKHKADVLSALANYPINWEPVTYHNQIPILSAAYDYLILRNKALALHGKTNFSLVHTRAGVPSIIGFWLKQKTGVAFLNDIRGFWADERVDGKMWNRKNPAFNFLYTYFKAKEKSALKIADYNITLTHAAKKYLIDSNAQLKIQVIPCSADLQLFNYNTTSRNEVYNLKKDLGIAENDFIISYLGSLGGWYLIDEMLLFFKRLLLKKPNAKFLFISGTDKQVILAAANKLGIAASSILVKSAKRNDVPALLSLSNYSIFFIKPCFSKMASSPTKHGEIMGMGIPVIANAGVGDVEVIINKTKTGIVVKDFKKETLDATIDTMLLQASNREEIRQSAFEFYDLSSAVEKYLFVYQSILNS
jgi:glycosyltransferase involved in cell wall biosynthesis